MAAPDGTGAFVTSTVADQRVRVVANSQNEGVGGATIKGIQKAIELNCDLVIKMDADCQMDPRYLETYAQLAQGGALYIKGNRLSQYRNYRSMPLVRLMGNLGLAMITRLGTGLREINDPTNGYIGLSRKLLDEIDLSELHRGYFLKRIYFISLKSSECAYIKSKCQLDTTNLPVIWTFPK
jgi:dolichol-phosphate mannosyltransferase